ncbi:MAG: hypothetical protein DCC75_09600 [Proteobacteria bacterium]|nr:MAG: hypothetical protein DCC75_09600 [Pseudomonadota bacterium]
MAGIDANEIWRQIPPEEKLELMARSQAKGVSVAFVTIIIAATLAVGLQMEWLMWVSIIISPMIFQFSAGTAWRGLRPKLILSYLAVRSAARRYAFALKGKELTLAMVFRGTLERQYDEDSAQEALEAVIEKTREVEVWIALFTDSVVMMSEKPGGAELTFGHLLNEHLEIESIVGSSQTEYANDLKLKFSVTEKEGPKHEYILSSDQPAALVVFSKKIQYLKQNYKAIDDTPVGEPPPTEESNLLEAGLWGG